MKFNNINIAIAIVIAIMFIAPFQMKGQVTPDSVNGYVFGDTVKCTAPVHYTGLSDDHAQGSTSQLFAFSITNWSWQEGDPIDPYPGVHWDKVLDSTYTAPNAIIVHCKLLDQSHPLAVTLIPDVIHGDTSTAHSGAQIFPGWNKYDISTGNGPHFFNKIRIGFIFGGLDTGSATVLLDSLILHYTWGNVMLDPFEQPSTFSTSTKSINFDSVVLTGSKQSSITAYCGGIMPLHVDSIILSNSAFTITTSSATIAPNDSTQFTVEFTPPDTGTYTGILIFQHKNASTPADTVTVSGTCIVPEGATRVYVAYEEGWNMISLPVCPAAGSKTPRMLFKYSGSYVQVDSMDMTIGYWKKLPLDSIYKTYVGNACNDSTPIVVAEKWNMIGALSHPVPIADLIGIPEGMTTSNFYGYMNGHYETVDTLLPGRAYWVKVDRDGVLKTHLPGNALAKAQGLNIVNDGELPPPPPGSEIRNPKSEIRNFALEQNYPNPFNPVTTIEYRIANHESRVHLSVYNLLGQEIVVLVDEAKEVGTYRVNWNASQMPSGMYFYQLQAGNYSETKKMLLLK